MPLPRVMVGVHELTEKHAMLLQHACKCYPNPYSKLKQTDFIVWERNSTLMREECTKMALFSASGFSPHLCSGIPRSYYEERTKPHDIGRSLNEQNYKVILDFSMEL